MQYKWQNNLVSTQTITISNELTGDDLIIIEPDDLIEAKTQTTNNKRIPDNSEL